MAWLLDNTHTALAFSTKHMMVTTVRGHFNKFTGTLNVDEQHPERSSVEITIDAASIDTREPNRDGHLRGADFFDVEKYPTLSFKSTRIEGDVNGEFKLIGNLTIKDVTREVTLNATNEGFGKDPWGGTRYGFTAETTINRKDFGLTWNVALETGGWLVGDQIKIHIDAEVIKKEEVVAAAGAAN